MYMDRVVHVLTIKKKTVLLFNELNLNEGSVYKYK